MARLAGFVVGSRSRCAEVAPAVDGGGRVSDAEFEGSEKKASAMTQLPGRLSPLMVGPDLAVVVDGGGGSRTRHGEQPW